MMDVRCPKCNKLLCQSDGHGTVEIKCPNCKHLVRFPARFAEIVEQTPVGSYRTLGSSEQKPVYPDIKK